MQKRFFATEFVLILLFFVFPPIVFPQPQGESIPLAVSWTVFAFAALAAVLWYHVRTNSFFPHEETTHAPFWVHQGQSLLTFGCLLVFAGICELLGRLFLPSATSAHLLAPQSVVGWLTMIAGTICAAFSEEVLYRVYIPGALTAFFPKRLLSAEIIAVVLFALAHRSLGPLAVLNALFAGCVLRHCYKKTGNLLTNLAAHSAYNIVLLLLLSVR